MAILSKVEITEGLKGYEGWVPNYAFIGKKFKFPSFARAMEFVKQVAEVAERLDHHPDITIRYNEVHLSLYSHDEGGITPRDIRLAKEIEALPLLRMG